MVGDDDKENTPLNSEKKRFNKRLNDEEANVGCAHKKRKCNVLSKDNSDDKKDAQIDSKTNYKLEETSPTEPGPSEVALDEETAKEKVSTTLDNRKFRKPNPSKKNTKKSNSKGQPKISFYFSNTKDEGRFLENSTKQTDPTSRFSAVLTPQFAVNSDFILVDDFHKIFLDY